MCKVSVLVPVYNVEKYLCQCLDSVVVQTLQDIEIICINDGSTDASLQLLREYQAKDGRIQIIDKPNSGYGHSMNMGLSVARGEYIGIVESDDFADKDMFARLYSVAVENDAELVRSNYWTYNEKDGDVFQEMMEGCPYDEVIIPYETSLKLWKDTFLWTSVYRKDFLNKNDIWFNETPGASYQDVGFTLKVLSCAKRVVLIRDAFLHYRTDNAFSSVNSKEKVFCKSEEFATVWEFLHKRPAIKAAVQFILPSVIYYHYVDTYWRISWRFKMGFLKMALHEFTEYKHNGMLDIDYWDRPAWDAMQKMIFDTKATYFKAYKRFQIQKMYLLGFEGKLKSFHKIYVYGAGQVGMTVIAYLQRREIRPNGILVSDKACNPDCLMGITVYTVESISPAEDTVILLAIREEDQYQVLPRLEEYGWGNIIVMDTELREVLQP